MHGHTNVKEGNILYYRNSTWPIAIEGHHYQHPCEVTVMKCRGVCGGGTVSTKRWDWFSSLHNSKLLVLVIFSFYFIVSGVSSNSVDALCDIDCWWELTNFYIHHLSCSSIWMTTNEMWAFVCRQYFLLPDIPMVFDKFCYNFIVRVLVCSTL
jgi:hypothetical protein